MVKRQLPSRKSRGHNSYFNIFKQSDNKNKTEKTRKQLKSIRITKNVKGNKINNLSDKQQKYREILLKRRNMLQTNRKKYQFTRGIHYFYDLNQLKRQQNSKSYAILPQILPYILRQNNDKKHNRNKNNILINNLYKNTTNKYNKIKNDVLIDKQPSITFSKDNELIGNQKISRLINRRLIGLPIKQQNIRMHLEQKEIVQNNKNNSQIISQILQQNHNQNQLSLNSLLDMLSNDKNQCHRYLFQIQDKKHNIDRMVQQLQYIKKRIAYYIKKQNIDKLMSYSVVQKDSQLKDVIVKEIKNNKNNQNSISKIINNNIGMTKIIINNIGMTKIINKQNKQRQKQIRQIIQDKLQIFYDKRIKINKLYEKISDLYYYDSLNQLLYNEIKKQKHKLSTYSIKKQLQQRINTYKDSIKQRQSYNIINCPSQIQLIYLSLQQQQKYELFSQQLNQYYCIDSRQLDNRLLDYSLKIILIRLLHQGQNFYYFGKQFFIKCFNQQIQLDKQIKSITLQEYTKKILIVREEMKKFYKNDKNKIKSIVRQNINNINKEQQYNQNKYNHIIQQQQQQQQYNHIIQQQKQSNIILHKKLQQNTKISQLSFFQYNFLILFYHLYESLSLIHQYLYKCDKRRLSSIIQIFSSVHYSRLQNKLLSLLQSAKLGILGQALDKMVQIIAHGNKNGKIYQIEKDKQGKDMYLQRKQQGNIQVYVRLSYHNPYDQNYYNKQEYNRKDKKDYQIIGKKNTIDKQINIIKKNKQKQVNKSIIFQQDKSNQHQQIVNVPRKKRK